MNAKTNRHVVRWGVVLSGWALAAALVGGCAAGGGVDDLTGPGVTAVREDLAAVNIGSADGVHIGQVYLVLRNEKPVASLRIGQVAEHSAAGHLFDISRRCTPGDQIAELPAIPTDRFATGPIHGEVRRVSGDFVSISAGSDVGVRGGQVLLVYRGGNFVANLRIVDVGTDISAGEVYDKMREPAVGDRVTSIGR